MKKRNIITIFYGDIANTKGPVIHFTELWNAMQKLHGDKIDIEGWFIEAKDNHLINILFRNRPVRIPELFKRNPFLLLWFDFVCAMRLLKHRKDLIYIRHAFYPLFTLAIIKLFNMDTVYELNGIIYKDRLKDNLTGWRLDFLRKIEIAQMANGRGCIAVSDGINDYAKSVGSPKTITILNGVSPNFLEYNNAEIANNLPIRIVYLGTYMAWDGAVEIPKLAKYFPEIEFHMIGNGTNKHIAIENAKGLLNVIFHDFVAYPDLPLEYTKYHCGIVLYDKERNDMKISSLKTLEYMASGLPIFSTKVPGQEYIEDNKIGMLSENSSHEQLVSDFRIFIQQLSLYKEYTEKYRAAKGHTHSWHNTANKTYDFIKSLNLL